MVRSKPASEREYQQLAAIDAVTNSLDESVHALKCRNGPPPISSIPTEVIAAIFLLVRTCGRPDIRLAHVCHRWREIALDYPLLWSRLDFTTVTPTGATEILARAKTAPLYLEAMVPVYLWNDARFVAFQKELQTHVSRICHLRISAKLDYLNGTLEGLIAPAPTLEHLSLSVETSGSMRPPRVIVPDTIFDATTPKLSSLELCDCNIRWKSPLLKGLKHLTITFKRSDGARPSLTNWLNALGEMPQLQRLVLDSASPSAPRFPFNVERTVTLPSLTRLDISTSELDCGLALAHLVLPSLTSLCVTVRSYHPTVTSVQNILPYVVQHAQGPQDTQPLQSMSIRAERTRIVILASSTTNIGVSEWDTSLSARVVLSVTTRRLHGALDDHIRILDTVITALPLDSLVMLTSPYNTRLDKDFWRRHVSQWPLLNHVCLAHLPARGLREMLLQDDGGREFPPFPSLETLELTECALSARRTHLLCDTLMKRVEQGVPLEVLDLRTCSATGLAIQLLSEIVVDVLAPEELEEIIGDKGPMDLTLDGSRDPFVSDDDSGVEFYSNGFNSYRVV